MSNLCEGFIAVHVGAGKHSIALTPKYELLSRQACEKGIESLKTTNSVVEAVADAIIVMEDSHLANAGYGSNLTFEGTVECDAIIMDGLNLQYGAIGAVPCVKNPIELAKRLLYHQNADIGHGRIPPNFLVGLGALAWAKEMKIPTISPESLISVKAEKIYKHYKRRIENGEEENESSKKMNTSLDTVGAVCVDKFGNIAAACSSGGIILKHAGRVGQAGIYGCGAWACAGNISVGTSVTGCGEHLIRTTFARAAAEAIVNTECPSMTLHDTMYSDFINSKFLQNVKEKLGGVLAIRYDIENDCGDCIWSHSTNSMIVGYMHSNYKSAKSQVCLSPPGDVGKKAVLEGVVFRFKKSDESKK